MRSGKFYRKNEREVMKNLGLKPTKNSGSGWIEKEDGENETIIAQLKSTDSESIKVNFPFMDSFSKRFMFLSRVYRIFCNIVMQCQISPQHKNIHI